MSMISTQIDELRKWADLYDGTAKPALSAELQRPYLAHGLRDAADTIWQLRCRLADAEDRVRKSGELCKLCEREAENAKLRELVADVHEALCSDKAGMFHELILASMEDDMRELGVEVEHE